MVRSIFFALAVSVIAVELSSTGPIFPQRFSNPSKTRVNLFNRAAKRCPKKVPTCKRSLPRFKRMPSYIGSVWLLQSSQDGYFLQIANDGTVNGTSDFGNEYTKFQIESLFPADGRLDKTRSYRIIRSKVTGRYLCMTGNTTGILVSKAREDTECIFESLKAPSSSSGTDTVMYRNVHCMFIGLRRNGKAKKGRRVNLCNRNAHFFEIHLSHYVKSVGHNKKKKP